MQKYYWKTILICICTNVFIIKTFRYGLRQSSIIAKDRRAGADLPCLGRQPTNDVSSRVHTCTTWRQLPVLSTWPAVTFPAAVRHHSLSLYHIILIGDRAIMRVNNLPKGRPTSCGKSITISITPPAIHADYHRFLVASTTLRLSASNTTPWGTKKPIFFCVHLF